MVKHWLLSRRDCVRTLNLETIDQGHPSPRRHGWAMAFNCGGRHLGKQQYNSELFYALDHERSSTCAGLHKVQEAPRRRTTEVQRCKNPLCLLLEARLQCRSIQGLWFRLAIDSLCGASDWAQRSAGRLPAAIEAHQMRGISSGTVENSPGDHFRTFTGSD